MVMGWMLYAANTPARNARGKNPRSPADKTKLGKDAKSHPVNRDVARLRTHNP